MDWFYKKIMAWAVGEALANSDRVKLAIYTGLGSLLALATPACPFCPALFTPAVMQTVAAGIVALGIKLIHSLDTRDVATPGEIVAGAAIPIGPPAATADGVPELPPA